MDKRTAITYIDSDGKWYRASKGAPEQVLLRLKGRYSKLLSTKANSRQILKGISSIQAGSKHLNYVYEVVLFQLLASQNHPIPYVYIL